MERQRRIAAYGVCLDERGRVLLVRASAESAQLGCWLLPGGGIVHGEHPARAAEREVAEQTGLQAKIITVRDVVADVVHLVDRPVAVHVDRIVYDMRVRGGTLRGAPAGSVDLARWVFRDELRDLPLLPFTAVLFGVPPAPRPAPPPRPGPSGPPDRPPSGPPPRPPRDTAVPPSGQRFAAYGLVTDPAGRILLTRISAGYPGAGKWHLPGGGTDFGEQPAAALLRELAEEADQVGDVIGLLNVSHRHNPRAVGPEGYPIDWHTVRALYQVRVGAPTTPRVTEAAGGSTAAAGWFSRAQAARLRLTEIAASALTNHRR